MDLETSCVNPAIDEGPFGMFLSAVREGIDSSMRQALEGVASRDIEEHLMCGKRLRGGLTVLLHDALGGTSRSAAFDLAAAVEISHAVCLIIDDMLDRDITRRDLPAVHVHLGLMGAIMEVFGLLSVPYGIASRYGGRAAGRLAHAHLLIVKGAKMEMGDLGDSWTHYRELTSLKTGELFALAAAYGALSAGAEEEVLDAASEFGRRCGIALQIADDMMDMDRGAEPPGCSGPMLARLLRMDEEGVRTGHRMLDASLKEAREAAATLISLSPGTDAALHGCVLGAPEEMVRMMLGERHLLPARDKG